MCWAPMRFTLSGSDRQGTFFVIYKTVVIEAFAILDRRHVLRKSARQDL